MKKLNYLLLGAAGLLMASCANDDLEAPNGDGLQITVKLPGELSTRAEGDNMVLNYAVYDSNNAVVETGQPTFSGQSTTLNLKLLSGQEYSIAFFAQDVNSSDVYSFDADAQTVSVTYSAMNSGDDNNNGVYDCFYGSLPSVKGGDTGVSVTLYRPLAQINWGTNDLDSQTVENTFKAGMYATLETEVYSSFDIISGELKGEKEKVTLGAWKTPEGDFPVGTGYTYVGMEYILAGPTSDLYDLNLYVSNAANGGTTTDVVVTAAPVQANYRTNIYGSLLTDNLSINVELGDWGGNILDPQDYGILESEGLYFNEKTKTYTVTSIVGMETFAAKANSFGIVDGGAYKGYTVVLDTDLDYTSTTHTPFNLQGALFDGNGHTISNLKLSATGETQLGFIYYGNGTVQNLNFTGANVSGQFSTGVVVGNAISTKINNVTVSNSTVISTPYAKNGSTYDDGNNAGIIAGYISGEFAASITNCTVSGCNVTAYRKVGGIAGSVNTNVVIKGNTVKNTTVTANQNIGNNSYDGEPRAYDAGEIYGAIINPATIENNTASNVIIKTVSSTGVTTNYVGSAEAWVTLSKTFSRANANQNIELTDDIDFGGATIYNFFFGGTFNGNGHTMSNMTITSTDSYSIGLFNRDAVGNPLTVNDITFKNINIDNQSRANGYVGVVCGDIQNNSTVTLNNVNVVNANLKGVQSVGGLVGFVAGGCTVNVNNCSVSNSNFTNYAVAGESGFVCGMVGRVVGTATFGKGNSVSNSTINAYWVEKRGESSIAPVAAPNSASVTINGLEGVTVTNVKITKTEVQ